MFIEKIVLKEAMEAEKGYFFFTICLYVYVIHKQVVIESIGLK